MRRARIAPRAAPTVRTEHGQCSSLHPPTRTLRRTLTPASHNPNQVRTEHGQYTGQWRDGCQHGSGAAHYQDGAHYKGEWVQGVASGAGRLRLPNRDVYEGETYCLPLTTHYSITTYYLLRTTYYSLLTSRTATCTMVTSTEGC